MKTAKRSAGSTSTEKRAFKTPMPTGHKPKASGNAASAKLPGSQHAKEAVSAAIAQVVRRTRGVVQTPATPAHPSGLDDVILTFVRGAPLERIDAERAGLAGALVKDLASRLGIANKRMFEVIGVPKATAEKKAASNAAITGAPGQAALGMVRLLSVANAIVANSTADAASDFDTAKWLGRWIEVPQPALGGRRPADVLDTPTGIETVAKLLGAIESGAYL